MEIRVLKIKLRNWSLENYLKINFWHQNMKKQEDDAHPIGGALDGGILKLIKKNMHGKIEG